MDGTWYPRGETGGWMGLSHCRGAGTVGPRYEYRRGLGPS
jgi:hypothetical protein